MPYPTNNRQNYRMRPNNAPPPTKNPYLSQQELRKKALEYNSGQQSSQDRVPINMNSDMRNQMNQQTAPQNMLRNTNDNTTERTTQTRQNMNSGTNDWATPTTRSWMDSLGTTPSISMPAEESGEQLSSPMNPYDENRSFPWMNPRGDERLSPSTTRDLPNRPIWLRQERVNSSNNGMSNDRNMNMSDSNNVDTSNNRNTQNGRTMESNSFSFLPRNIKENKEYMDMIRRHPEDVRRIYAEVKKAFDRLDYEGSWIYDENPDRQTLVRLSEDIYRTLLPITEDYDPDTDNPDSMEEENRTPGLLPNKTSSRWMLYVIFILVQNELMNRRV